MYYKAAGLSVPLALLACAPVEDDEPFISKAPAAAVIGDPQRCLNPSLITNSTVYDDRTIDFKSGSRTYRNTLPSSCARLGYERAISYDVRGGSLCAGETIYVLESFGGRPQRGTPCALGEFVPVEIVKDD